MLESNQSPPNIFRIIKYSIILLVVFLIFNYLHQNSSLFYRKFITTPFSLHLNEYDLYMIKGEEFHLFVYDINKRVTFTSTNFRVAGVNFNGRIFAYRTGKAFITAKVGKKELRCRVHVIDINTRKIELKAGETYKLKILGTSAFISWSSKDKKTAQVNMFGKVTALNKGTTYIYAKVKGRKLKCEIKVY